LDDEPAGRARYRVGTSAIGTRISSACTVVSVSISKRCDCAGNDFTNRRENTRYPDSMSAGWWPKSMPSSAFSMRLPKACPRRYAAGSSCSRTAVTMSRPSSTSRATRSGARDAS